MKLIVATLLSLASVLSPMANAGDQGASANQVVKAGVSLLDINTATEKDLLALPGIGQKKAAAIIQYRDSEGKISSLEDLQNVPGIGKKVAAKLADKIRF